MKNKMKATDACVTGIIDSKGGMFDVTNEEMENNIGKQIKYKNPRCLIENKTFVIGGIQKIYTGEIAYRVFCDGYNFGRPALPSEIEFI